MSIRLCNLGSINDANNVLPAIIANGFALEPLLIVGLMSSDMMRVGSSVPSTILGTAASASLVGGGVLLASLGPPGTAVAIAVALAATVTALVLAIRQLRTQASMAAAIGAAVRIDSESRVRV